MSSNIIENKNDHIFSIYKDGKKYHFNEYPKNQEMSYRNITFTMPGTWYEEDNEDDYKFYYLDDPGNNDHMTLKELSKFKEKDYKKDFEIIEEKNLTNQYYEIFYYKVKIDETHIEQRAIIKGDSIYEFSLSSEKERAPKYYKELLNIIDSINIK